MAAHPDKVVMRTFRYWMSPKVKSNHKQEPFKVVTFAILAVYLSTKAKNFNATVRILAVRSCKGTEQELIPRGRSEHTIVYSLVLFSTANSFIV